MAFTKTAFSVTEEHCVLHPRQGLAPQLLLQHGPNLLGGSLIIQMFCCVPESIEKTFYTIRRLILKNFDTTFHINFRSFGKCSHWMDVVIEYYDTHHYPQAE